MGSTGLAAAEPYPGKVTWISCKGQSTPKKEEKKNDDSGFGKEMKQTFNINENSDVVIYVIPTFRSKIFYPDLFRHAFVFWCLLAFVVVLRSEVMTWVFFSE